MLIVRDISEFQEDAIYQIKSDETYLLIDTDKHTSKQIKGSSLMARLRKEHANGTINLDTGKGTLEGKAISLKSSSDYINEIKQYNSVQYDYSFKKTSKLSNYYECPVFYEGRMYKSSEAAYQSAKTLDTRIRDTFVDLCADDAKKLGKKIQNSDKLRPDWLNVQSSVMESVVKDKFMRNKDCYEELIATRGKDLIEDTTGWHDKRWGICYCDQCRGIGRNKLGYILTRLRKEFIGE